VHGGGDLRAAQTIAAAASLAETGIVTLTPGERTYDGLTVWGPREAPAQDPRAEAASTIAWIRSAEGHPSDRWWTADSASAVSRALREHRPDVVILEHLWTRRALAPARRAGASVVLNSQNVEARVHEELVELGSRSGFPPALARRLAERTATLEAATVATVDQVWAVSAEDIEQFRRRYPRCGPVWLVPNGLDTGIVSMREQPPSVPTVLFPASFSYPPNASAASWLASEVLPLLRAQLAEVRLLFAGSGQPYALHELATRDRSVRVIGGREDMRPVFAGATAVAVPIRAGGGSRYKILEAFAAGVPVVSTVKGIEGIAARPEREYLPADTAAEFAGAIARLWRDPQLAATLVGRARRLVEERYSWRAVTDQMAAALRALPRRRSPA
jgi:polysaccharide biosynthesis protein PslH